LELEPIVLVPVPLVTDTDLGAEAATGLLEFDWDWLTWSLPSSRLAV